MSSLCIYTSSSLIFYYQRIWSTVRRLSSGRHFIVSALGPNAEKWPPVVHSWHVLHSKLLWWTEIHHMFMKVISVYSYKCQVSRLKSLFNFTERNQRCWDKRATSGIQTRKAVRDLVQCMFSALHGRCADEWAEMINIFVSEALNTFMSRNSIKHKVAYLFSPRL